MTDSGKSTVTLWRGGFGSTSNTQVMVRGQLEVLLPWPLHINSKTEADAAFTYEGMYKNGARKIIHFSVRGDLSSDSTNKVEFNGQLDAQTITFKCANITDVKISGTYETSGPVDIGNFFVDITNETTLDRTERGMCSIS